MAFEDTDSTSSVASLRLGKLSNTPGTAELDFALAQAKQNPSATIELPWKTSVSPTFVLQLSCPDPDFETNWVLLKGETADAAVLWSFDSDDTSLIESLLAAECGPDRSFTGVFGDNNGSSPPGATKGSSSLDLGGILSPANPANPGAAIPLVASPAILQVQLPPPVEFDRSMLEQIENNLRDAESGLTSRAGFYFFMVREYNRYQAVKAPMAVIVFELFADYGSDKIMVLPERALKEVFKRFQSIMRSIDILAHYQDKQYAFLLPGATSNDAVQFGKRLEKALADNPLQPGIDRDQAILCAGVASIPDTCDHPGVLLAACEQALAQAKERRTGLALFPSMARS